MQRTTLIGVLLLLAFQAPVFPALVFPAWAQSLERAYIAARGAAATKLESMKGDAFDKAQVEAQRSLEPKLRSIIGPLVAPLGFSGRGEFHPTALCCELGAGALDGLSFADGKDGNVVVTTE